MFFKRGLLTQVSLGLASFPGGPCTGAWGAQRGSTSSKRSSPPSLMATMAWARTDGLAQ